MSRWHTPECGGGDENTRVDSDGLPHCQICKSSPDLPRLLSQLVAESPGLQIPPDEPPGQLNLSWPPTIAYSRSTPTGGAAGSAACDPDVHALSQSAAGANTSVNNDSQPVSAVLESDKPPSPIYPKALSPDEFRLLVLDSCDTPAPGDETTHEWPVHVSLETYRDGDRPEYETVSYTWGGEDDDSSPSKPVYVGPYWDALFQTKNCYEMLRHLRPNRGVRFIWVDAICINQNDLDERAQQVAKMRTIYSNSWRVIVYLGSDIINPVPKRSVYPAKKRLEDLDTSAAGESLLFPDLSLREVLERRYFSRIWVIQELLLSKQICIRIRDMELIIDRSAKPNLFDVDHAGKGCLSWKTTKAPWMAHAAQGTVANPAELLRMTQFSKASDPRDKAFGIMALFHPSLSLVPDYSLSLVRTRVGFAGHILLNGNSPGILLHPGPRHMGQHPSWVPWPSTGDAAWRHPTQSMDESWQSLLVGHYRLRLPIVALSIQPLTEDRPDPGYDWRTGAHIEELSGSLSIRLVHLMPLKTMPVQISRADGFTITRLEAPSQNKQRPFHQQTGTWEFCLVFQDSPYHLDLVPREDHVFMLSPTSHDTGPQFMIMRKALGRPLAFRLVACCHRIFVCCRICHRLASFPPFVHTDTSIARLRRDFIRGIRDTGLFFLINQFFEEPDLGSHLVRLACLIYRGHRMSPAFPLDTIPGRLPSDSAVLCALMAALKMLEPDLTPGILEFQGMDCLELRLSNSGMRGPPDRVRRMLRAMLKAGRNDFVGVPSPIPKIRFWRRGDTWRPKFTRTTPPPPRIYTEIPDSEPDEALEAFIDMIISPADHIFSAYFLVPVLEDIKEYIQGDEEPALKTLARMRQDSLLDTGEVREDSLTMALKWIKALSKEPDSTVDTEGPSSWEADIDPNMLRAFPDWPDDLVEDFGIDGSTYQVTIV
ncbi:hypothetical protein MAPG_11429 [Magnaporthiopsis poae ATCC 64411]|uniref:Heterokaryon incompatibility domain-containing protein n=1 Tax=Magnaporthiopsis poae (strain ATCC 64411 / 73-15) TaxID=644358 RepID=A0A0C4EF90_MAGP6|nr:hypothetical protein MAPG_11429 [Magnaporthiopsis poae ATCC 64411]